VALQAVRHSLLLLLLLLLLSLSHVCLCHVSLHVSRICCRSLGWWSTRGLHFLALLVGVFLFFEPPEKDIFTGAAVITDAPT